MGALCILLWVQSHFLLTLSTWKYPLSGQLLLVKCGWAAAGS